MPTLESENVSVHLDFDSICEDWERYKGKPPKVFFRVGNFTVARDEAGVDPYNSSVCRQFWDWLGTEINYTPAMIYVEQNQLGHIYMSIPGINDFAITIRDGPMQTSIQRRGDDVHAELRTTRHFERSPFKSYRWADDLPIKSKKRLAYITARVEEEDTIYIAGFYSKAGDDGAEPLMNEREKAMLKGSGKRLLCNMLRTISGLTYVYLMPVGGFPAHRRELIQKAETMSREDFIADIVRLKEHYERKKLSASELANEEKYYRIWDPRTTWFDEMTNELLVKYYMKHYGFVLDRDDENKWKRYDYLVTSYEDIINHCEGRQMERDEDM